MKKTFLLLIALLTLCFAMAAPVQAAEIEPISASLNADLVIDKAGLLSAAERTKLNDLANEITDKYQCEVIINIIPQMEGWLTEVDEYAADFIRNNGVGYGSDKSAVMLMLVTEDRDYALAAKGFGNVAFTDHGKDVIMDKYVLPQLKNDNNYEAFLVFLNKAEEFLAMARAGTPFDIDTDEELLARNAQTNHVVKIVFNILIPLLVALIVCMVFRAQMKTARKQRAAASYIPEGGFVLTGSSDQYLYSTETRRTIESSSSSGGTTTSGGVSVKSGKY